MSDAYIRFLNADTGQEEFGSSVCPRHLDVGHIVAFGGTHDAPARKFVIVSDPPAIHHAGSGTAGAIWRSVYYVRPA